MRRALWLLSLSLCVVTRAFAQSGGASGARLTDAQEAAQRAGSIMLAAATGPRTSPFEPPEESDRLFVVDGAPGLDTGCTYRSGGPLRFDIAITRWVGPVDGTGRLVDASALIAAGVLSATAEIILPAFDVDVNGASGFPPEVDRISLNGKVLGTLTGDNGIWKLNQFTVDIADLRFPERGAFGAKPTPALNTIQIDIDTASGSNENWCTSIDWAATSFKAMSPVVLTHGNNSDAGFWDRHGFANALASAHIPVDGCADITICRNPLNMQTSFVAVNGARLATLIPGIVQSFGADSYHIVAHSKGGLDSREYLANHAPADLTLLSHNTLSTPHNGSVLADLVVAYSSAASAARRRFVGFPSFTGLLLSQSAIDDGTRNLTLSFTAGFNSRNISALPDADYNQVAADADRNGSDSINSEAEIAALRLDDSAGSLPGPTFIATRILDRPYQILRNSAAVTTAASTELIVLRGGLVVQVPVLTITSVPNPTPLGNDVLVTIPSGRGVGSIQGLSTGSATFTGAAGRNHSDVANGGVAATVIPWLLRAERTRGDLQ